MEFTSKYLVKLVAIGTNCNRNFHDNRQTTYYGRGGEILLSITPEAVAEFGYNTAAEAEKKHPFKLSPNSYWRQSIEIVKYDFPVYGGRN